MEIGYWKYWRQGKSNLAVAVTSRPSMVVSLHGWPRKNFVVLEPSDVATYLGWEY